MTDTPLTAADLSALLAWTRGEILEWPLRARDGEPLDVILLATCAALTERAEKAEANLRRYCRHQWNPRNLAFAVCDLCGEFQSAPALEGTR